MLNRLRAQFVAAATLALLLALALVMVFGYYLATGTFEQQINTIIDVLLENDGVMPTTSFHFEPVGRLVITPEQQFETRFFSVTLGENGTVSAVNTLSVFSVDDKEAVTIAKNLTQQELSDGQIIYDNSVYFYKSKLHSDGSRLFVFVDCTSRVWIIRQVLYYLLLVGFIILLFFSLILIFLSKRVVNPFIRNSEKQKQFITNASHELKTPLAVISANTEMVEMLNGKDKWTESTMRQVKRLNSLVSELVTLSKLDEKDEVVLADVDVSQVVTEQADTFEQVILQQGKRFEREITEGLHIKAERRGVQELASILLDNAAKYCDDGGVVKLSCTAKAQGKGARLAVSNSYQNGAGVDYRRFFERFYKEDESHNSKKSGFGIGLSIAQEICNRLGARIQVSYKNGEITFTILFK
ncbi:MAG: HAMP domain-containing histidine kinase [Lachnospiraceae bacterium]|nr:HAMP domain-containing histidine kinase [Lachnospiraceae bacterium]